MTIYVNENGTWIPIQQPYVYDDSVWRQVSNQYVNEASTWRKVFPDVGELWTWGEQTSDSFTVAGNNSFTRTDRSTPVTTSVGGINWTQVATGEYRTAGIKDDGTLWTWGHNTTLHIANSLGLGRIVTQSLYSIPQIQDPGSTNWADTPTSNAEDLHTVSSGGRVSGAIKTDGTLWMWGPNDVGQLGIPSFPLGSPVGISSYSRETPVTTFIGGTNWKQISCGYQHAGAVKTDGTLWMWGHNGNAALGTQDAVNRSTPVTTFAGGTNWKQVSCGQSHTLAIKTDGTLWVWGSNDGGKLGVFNRSDLFGYVYTPATTFTGGTDWNNCSAGHSHSSAVKTDGTLWTWGRTSIDFNTRGKVSEQDEPYTDLGDRLGRANANSAEQRLTFSQRLTPVTTFTGGTNWLDTPTSNPDLMSSISVGFDHSAAIKTDGTLWLWGNPSVGQLGNAIIFATPTSQLSAIAFNWGYATPVTTFAGGTNWKQVSCGFRFTAAIKTDGTLWMWGNNYYTSGSNVSGGWLGINSGLTSFVSTPVTTFAGGTNWKQVSCGYYHVAAVKTDGSIWTWGNGQNFKLMQGSLSAGAPTWSRPTQPVVSTDWKQVSCGREHTAAIKTDGTLWAWGNAWGLGNAKPASQFPMSTPMTTFAGGNNWKQVFCGTFHTSAVKTDGTLWTWGNISNANLGNGITQLIDALVSTPITTFAGGTNWAYVNNRAAIKTDGTLWTWGSPTGGALGSNIQAHPTSALINLNSTPVTTFAGGTNWTQVQRSQEGTHVIGLKTDGTLWVWGGNRTGQLGISRNNSSFDPNFTDWDANSNLSTPLPNTTYTGGNNWKQVSCGRFHTAAVKTDGTLWTWGHNSTQGSVVGALGHNANSTVSRTETPITTLAGGNDWKQVSCGPYNTSAVKTDGTLWIWGENTLKHYMASPGFFQSTSYPITVAGGGNNWTQVSIGSSSHVTALKTDGTLWTWGNSFASTRVNTGTKDYLFGIKTKDALVPNPVEGNNWKQVAISKNANIGAAIKTDGTLWMWGAGSSASLGRNNDLTNSLTPVTTFVGGNDWKQVSLSGSLSTNGCTVAAVKTDGTLWMWGYNPSSNIFGANIPTSFVSTPITTFIGGNDWKSVNLSERCAAAIKTDGTLWVWGNNFNSRKISESDSLTIQQSIPTTTALGGTNWKKVAIGDYSISALKTDGTLWTWGNNSNAGAFLGRGDAVTHRITPITTFIGGTDWADTPTSNAEDLYTISANVYSTAAIKTDGTLWTWGYNQDGQLGKPYNFLDVTASTPITTFAGGNNWKQVSCATGHTAAIKTDGTLWIWGNNNGGKLGVYPDILGFYTSIFLSSYASGEPRTTFAGGTNWKHISCGRDSTAAIKTDGTLWFWGYNRTTTNSLTNFSYNHLVNRTTFAITPITTFVGGTDWADTPTSNAEDLYTVSSGSRMNGAIKTDGTLWIWGRNNSYGFGLLNQDMSPTPIQILSGTAWRQISCTTNKAAAIKTDGTLWIWGRGSNGDLGNATFQSTSTPVTTFAGGNNWKQVSATSLNCGAIKTDGTLWMWGQASYGKLGNTWTSGSRSTPVTTFAGGTNWKQVSCGLDSTVAIKTDGGLWRWGRCAHGLGGPFSTLTNNSSPTSLGANSPGSVAWKQVSSAYRHAGGIKTDGTLWMWGNLQFGRLGNNLNTFLNSSTPVTTFAGGTNWKQVACGGNATAAIKTDGTLWTWGLFPLGNNRYTIGSLTPVTTFAGGTDWSQVFVSSGSNSSELAPSGHIIARKTDGTLWTWGNSGTLSSEHEFALGADVADPTIPQKSILFGDNWNQISINVGYGGGVKTNGSLWMWGNNSNWKLGTRQTTSGLSVDFTTTTPVTTFVGGFTWKQVSCGYNHAAAVKTDGTLWTWGTANLGALGGNQLGEEKPYPTPLGGFNWKQVSCSTVSGLTFSFTAAVKTDGTLWTWGNNSYGQLGLNNTDYKLTPVTTFTGGTNWTQVYCGERHITALKTDGTLWTWGGTQYEGFYSIPVLSSTLGAAADQRFFGTVDGLWKDVSTQEATQSSNTQTTSGVKMDGTLWMWGRSQHGALGDAIDSNYVSRPFPVTTALGGNNWVSVDVGGDRISAVKKTGL